MRKRIKVTDPCTNCMLNLIARKSEKSVCSQLRILAMQFTDSVWPLSKPQGHFWKKKKSEMHMESRKNSQDEHTACHCNWHSVVLAGVGGVGMVVPGYRNSWKTIGLSYKGKWDLTKYQSMIGRTVFSMNDAGKNWKLKRKRMKLDPHLKPIIKSTSEGACHKHKSDTVKPWGQWRGATLCHQSWWFLGQCREVTLCH